MLRCSLIRRLVKFYVMKHIVGHRKKPAEASDETEIWDETDWQAHWGVNVKLFMTKELGGQSNVKQWKVHKKANYKTCFKLFNFAEESLKANHDNDVRKHDQAYCSGKKVWFGLLLSLRKNLQDLRFLKTDNFKVVSIGVLSTNHKKEFAFHLMNSYRVTITLTEANQCNDYVIFIRLQAIIFWRERLIIIKWYETTLDRKSYEIPLGIPLQSE